MRVFLVAVSGVFASIALFWDGIGTQIAGLGTLGNFLAVGYFVLSTTFSDLAQLCLTGAVAADELQQQVDGIRSDLGETLLESALGEAITSIWPEFPIFVLDSSQWAIDILSDFSPELAAFLIDPEAWILAILERWLPIDIQGSGFETMDVGGDPFYFNHDTPTGAGFEFQIPAGAWRAVWVTFYGLVSPSSIVSVSVYRAGVLLYTFPLAPGATDGQTFGVSVAFDADGLTTGVTWRVLAATSGSMAFQEWVSLQPGEGEPGWGTAGISLVGPAGPASWSFDFSGFIDWLEGAFLSVSEALYALLERILRYFWEGVY